MSALTSAYILSLQLKLFGRKGKKKTPKQDTGAAEEVVKELTPERPRRMKTPWREGIWTKEYAVKLLKDIQKHEINEEDVPNIRILLLGQIKAGKSSFLNTVASLDKGRISQITTVGSAGSSHTLTLKEYRPQFKLKNFRILDTMGMENNDQNGLHLKDVQLLVKGHISPDYTFNPVAPIDEDSGKLRSDPKKGEEVHCIVYVIDASVLGQHNISDATRIKIGAVQDELKRLDIPRIVLLTKIDLLCELVEEDIENTYFSAKVKEAVDLAKELYHVSIQNIFPVQNYQHEIEIDYKKEILPLLALKQMIYFGSDFLNAISAPDDKGSKK